MTSGHVLLYDAVILMITFTQGCRFLAQATRVRLLSLNKLEHTTTETMSPHTQGGVERGSLLEPLPEQKQLEQTRGTDQEGDQDRHELGKLRPLQRCQEVRACVRSATFSTFQFCFTYQRRLAPGVGGREILSWDHNPT